MSHKPAPPTSDDQLAEVWRREAEFHDQVAAGFSVESMPQRPPDALEAALLSLAGDLTGKRVLEIGCGHGDLTLHLLDRGATLTALDVSPGMVEVARQRCALIHPDADVEFVVAPAERTGLADATFDVIVGKWILHHVDLTTVLPEIRRLMAPGATGLFIENQTTNPILRFARRHIAGRAGIPRLGTEDEHPLEIEDYHLLEANFGSVGRHYPDFAFCTLFDRQVLQFRWPAASRAFRAVDEMVFRRLPRARRYSFHVIVGLSAT